MVRRGNKKHYIPAIIWAVVILVGTSTPYLTPPPLGLTWQDKLEHFAAYGMFGLTVAYGNIRTDKRKQFLLALTICSIFGALDEIHQHWIPGRSMDIFDWVADTLGALTGATLMVLTQKYWLPWIGGKSRAPK